MTELFFPTYFGSKIGVRVIHRCALYTPKYGNNNATKMQHNSMIMQQNATQLNDNATKKQRHRILMCITRIFPLIFYLKSGCALYTRTKKKYFFQVDLKRMKAQ